MVREVAAVQRLPADLPEARRVPPVPPGQGHGDSELPGLPGDRGDLGVVAGDVDALRVRGLDLRELRAEVGIALAVRLLRHDLAPELLVVLPEERLKSDGVVVADVGE